MSDIAKRASSDLTHYEPERGLKTVAVAEAAEKHYRRAKDATNLLEAVELKLSEQRKFVLWWDGQEKAAGARGNPGGRGARLVASQTDNATSLHDLGLDRDTVHRWRTRLKVEKDYERTLQAAQQRAIRVCEFAKGQTDQRGASGTEDNEWYTPAEYIEAARDVLGAINLDPASSAHAQKWIKAADYFTRTDDGLAHEWPGRVWLNPPYMQPDIERFVEKLCTEVEAARTTAAILLTHNYTDTAWFHRAAGLALAICFTRGRVRFLNAAGDEASPTQGQAFFYFGDGALLSRFVERFTALGFVVMPV